MQNMLIVFLYVRIFEKMINIGVMQMAGMKESKEFAGELFDALARKRNVQGDSISKDLLKDFWEQIADQSFDSRLQTFFDMYR